MRLRLRFLAVPLAFAPLAFTQACIDPEGTMDDYLERTKSIRGVTDAATVEVSVGDGGLASGTYYVVCLPALAGGNLNQALRFKAVVTYTEGAPDPTLALQFQILPIGATTTGAALGAIFPTPPASSPVRNGYFDLNFGASPDLPKEGNGLTGVDFGLDGLTVEGLLTQPPNRFCAALNGKTRPSGLEIKRDLDFCIGQKVDSDTQEMPVPAADEYACPVPTPKPF